MKMFSKYGFLAAVVLAGCTVGSVHPSKKSVPSDEQVGLHTETGKKAALGYYSGIIRSMYRRHGADFQPEFDLNREDLQGLQWAQWELYKAGHVLVPPAYVGSSMADEFRWDVDCSSRSESATCELKFPVADGIWGVLQMEVYFDQLQQIVVERTHRWVDPVEYSRETIERPELAAPKGPTPSSLASFSFEFGPSLLKNEFGVDGCGTGNLAIDRRQACAENPAICDPEMAYRQLLQVSQWVDDPEGQWANKGDDGDRFPFGGLLERQQGLLAVAIESLRKDPPQIAGENLPPNALDIATHYGIESTAVRLDYELSINSDQFKTMMTAGLFPWRLRAHKNPGDSTPLPTFSFYVTDFSKGWLNEHSVVGLFEAPSNSPQLRNGGVGRMIGLMCAAPAQSAPLSDN